MEATCPSTLGNALNYIKEYKLKFNNDSYNLSLELYLDEKIFKKIE